MSFVHSTIKSSTCNCQIIVRDFRFVTLNNMTHVNPSANAFCMSTTTLDEIVAHWGLWHVLAHPNVSGKVNF